MKIIACDAVTTHAFSIQCELGITIERLKQKICEEVGLTRDSIITLQFEGKWLLKPLLSLYDYNIREGSIIHYRVVEKVGQVTGAIQVKKVPIYGVINGVANKKKQKIEIKRDKKELKRQGPHQEQANDSHYENESILKQLFFQRLKRNEIRDEVLQILNKQEIYSIEQLKACSQQMLISVGIPLGQILKLKKI